MASGNLSVHRRELGLSSGNLARASNMLANAEDKQDLSRRLANVGTIYENLGEIYTDLSDKDLYDFSELLSDQVKMTAKESVLLKWVLGARSRWNQKHPRSATENVAKLAIVGARAHEEARHGHKGNPAALRTFSNKFLIQLQATGRTEKIPGAELEIKGDCQFC